MQAVLRKISKMLNENEIKGSLPTQQQDCVMPIHLIVRHVDSHFPSKYMLLSYPDWHHQSQHYLNALSRAPRLSDACWLDIDSERRLSNIVLISWNCPPTKHTELGLDHDRRYPPTLPINTSELGSWELYSRFNTCDMTDTRETLVHQG